MSVESIRQRAIEFVTAAMALTARDETMSVSSEDLMVSLKEVVPRDDAEKAHERKCKKILDDSTHPGFSEAFGQLRFAFGSDVYAYEPERPLKTENGRIVELKYALPGDTLAEARRARKKAQEDMVWVERKQTAADSHGAWALNQVNAGRPLAECTYHTFVTEEGILEP